MTQTDEQENEKLKKQVSRLKLENERLLNLVAGNDGSILQVDNLRNEIARLTEIIYDYQEICGEFSTVNPRPCILFSIPEYLSKGIKSPKTIPEIKRG